MKKVLTVLLATSMLAVAPMAMFAEEDNKNPTAGQVDLTATVGSAYYLQIPTSVDVSDVSKTFDILVKGDVDSAKKITIVEDKGAQGTDVNYLVDGADNNNKVAITTSVSGSVNGANIQSEYGEAKITFTVTHDALTAGTYACQMPIKISLDSIA